jgi:hypothetical protein
MARIAQLKSEWMASYRHQMAVFELFQQFPQMQDNHKHLYITINANLLAACHLNQRYHEMPDILSFVKAVVPQTKLQSVEIEQNVRYYRLLYAINTNHWEEVPEILAGISKFLEKDGHLINKARWLAMRYNVAISFFLLGENKSALNAVNAILNDERSSNRLDILQAARLLLALLHYELGNLDLLEYLLRSARRQLKAEHALHAFEEGLLQHLGWLAKNPEGRRKTLESLEIRVNELLNDPNHAMAPGINEIHCWIVSHLQGRPMTEVLAAKMASA